MTMIYIFAIQLVSRRKLQGMKEKLDLRRCLLALAVSVVGAATVIAVQLKQDMLTRFCDVEDTEVTMDVIGTALVGSDKYQYVLPFEFISIFLLACIIGGLVVARNKEEDKQS